MNPTLEASGDTDLGAGTTEGVSRIALESWFGWLLKDCHSHSVPSSFASQQPAW